MAETEVPLALTRKRLPRPRGFTLIEILIVISIIALLASFVLMAVNKVKKDSLKVMARQTVEGLSAALDLYYSDESEYPGSELRSDPQRNDFPELFNALFGEPKPRGPGGRSAPYMPIKEDQVVVADAAVEGDYTKAKTSQIRDPDERKFILDPWGSPFIYRCNKGKRAEGWMKNTRKVDIYSWGPNGKDDTIDEVEESDDIGNW